MKISLTVLNAGKAAGQSIPIGTPQFVIGRDPKCNLRPASAMISKQHCALFVKDGKVLLRDFDSTNGTFVNDQPVKGVVPLADGDILKVGPLQFKVNVEGAPAVNKPTPPPKPKAAEAVSHDEDAAALLLSLDDDTPPGVSTTTDEGEVPGGSTVMDMPAIGAPGAEDAKTEEAKKDEKTKAAEKARAAAASAQSAAQSILDRYRKGQRRTPQ